MRDFSPLFKLWIEQLTACITQFIPPEELGRHYDIVVNSKRKLKESRQIIIADHPPVVYDSLVALGRILNLCESAEAPSATLSTGEAVSAGVSALVAGFNLGRSMDEEIAKPLIAYIDKFYYAGKRPRPKKMTDALDRVIENICVTYLHKNNQFPNYHQVIREIKKLATQGNDIHDVIVRVEEDDNMQGVVYWLRKKNDERPMQTALSTIRNRLTPIRKKLLIPK